MKHPVVPTPVDDGIRRTVAPDRYLIRVRDVQAAAVVGVIPVAPSRTKGVSSVAADVRHRLRHVTDDNWLYSNLVINAGLGPGLGRSGKTIPLTIPASGSTPATRRLPRQTHTSTTTPCMANGWSGAVFPGETGSLLIDPGALARSTTVHLSNNIIYSTGEPYLAGESTSLPADDYGNCWYGYGSPPSWDTTAINDDPDFVNPATFNLQLQTDSPCIDAGHDVSSVVTHDILGVPRPQGVTYDLGAYEFVTGTVSPQHLVYLPLILRQSP